MVFDLSGDYSGLIKSAPYAVLSAMRGASSFTPEEVAQQTGIPARDVEAVLLSFYGTVPHSPADRGGAVREAESTLVTCFQDGKFALTHRGRKVITSLTKLING